MSPTSGSTESCTGVTTSRLQDWQSIGLKQAITGEERGIGAPREPQTQLSVVSTENQSTNPCSQKRMVSFWLCRRGFSVMKSVHSSTVAQPNVLFPQPE